MRRGRILAVDYGSKNVGLACSDELAMTVRPLASIPNRGRKSLLNTLSQTVSEKGVESLVVGIPWNMNGSSGRSVEQVRQFIRDLGEEVTVPVHEVDERLSTLEALELWNSMSPRQKRRYRTVDSLAAAFILERFMREAFR